jgi:ornithine cyclodeaminase/alanine dehydrogenase-like protein (mu-crystallin family)
MRATLDLHVAPVLSAKEAVADADVVMCATTSTTPVFDPRWLKPGTHVNTVGPRAQGASEVDARIAGRVQLVATDSLRQLRSYAQPSFLADTPGWKPWLNWARLWWVSTRDATPPRT